MATFAERFTQLRKESRLTQEEIGQIIEKSQELAQWQDTEDTKEDLERLPLLTREDLKKQASDIQVKMEEAQDQLSELSSKMKTLNTQIHYTGQYFASKSVYAEFLKSRNKKKFRQEHLHTAHHWKR